LALCLETYRELQGLNPEHELLSFGDVKPEDRDCNFYLNENNRLEFNKRFAKDGIYPRGHHACTYALAHYASALIKAIDETKWRDIGESKLVEKIEPQTQGSSDIPF